MKQDTVGSRFFIGLGAPQRLFLAKAGDERLRSGDHNETFFPTRGYGALDLSGKLPNGQ